MISPINKAVADALIKKIKELGPAVEKAYDEVKAIENEILQNKVNAKKNKDNQDAVKKMGELMRKLMEKRYIFQDEKKKALLVEKKKK